MLSTQKSSFEKHLEPLALMLRHVDPNLLTLLGSIPSLLFFVLLINHAYTAALIVFLFTAIDMLDGMVARKFHKTTPFGGFLDSFMDRISDFFIIVAFSFSGIVRWEIAAPLLMMAYLTSYARSRGELAKLGVNFAVGIIERTERLVLIFLALLFYILTPSLIISGFNTAEVVFIIITTLSFITVLQRVIHAYRKL